MKRYLTSVCGAWLLLVTVSLTSYAEVTRVEVTTRQDVLGGRAFGAVGAYEWVAGRAYFTLDPLNPKNDIITDLKLAARNDRGQVEFSADFAVLRPKDPARANGVLLFDVVNRGRIEILSFLNQATGTSRSTESYFGDGFLMRQGVTIVWLGWEQDLPQPPDLLHLVGPTVKGITGLVSADLQFPKRVTDVPLANRGMTPYAVAGASAVENRLTVRASRDAIQTLVPRDQWTFGRLQNGTVVNDLTRLYLKGGFEPGAIYQIVYLAKDPYVAGLGFAAVRDLLAWVRYEPNALVHATYAYAFGISQSGRFLRQFVHDGFNADLSGRQVFDGMMIHIAGGSSRGFNERFAQPSEDSMSRVFPFTDADQTDPETGKTDGLLAKARQAGVIPKILYTSSSWEYWGSLASAIHTKIDRPQDIDIPETSRVYLLASTQHVPPAFPPEHSVAAATPPVTGAQMVAALVERGQLKVNPLDYRPVLRALFVALDQWVRIGTAPPASRVPRIADGTLVPRTQLNTKGLRTVNVPADGQQFFRLESGEKTWGVPTIVPPHRGKPYISLVSQVDDDGNDLAGIRVPELVVPLATHAGWNLRDSSIGASMDLVALTGSYIPFAGTRVERERIGDTRLSIEERYSSLQYYLGLVAQSAHALVDQRLTLVQISF